MTTKDRILAALLRADEPVSGERLGNDLQISRAAVNAAITSLKEEGYEIESATRRGYRLLQSPNHLNTGEVLACLKDESRFETLLVLDEIDSTNRLLIQMASEGAEDGQVIIADHQSAGRGRLGRSFASPAGMGVYLSYLIRPEAERMQASDWTAITSWTAVAVSDAVEKACGVRPGIKWVNDLYLPRAGNDGEDGVGGKIAGILTQMDMDAESGGVRSIVIGIGVNVLERKKDFPEEIRDLAGSLYTATKKDVSRAFLAAQMVLALDEMRAAWPKERTRYLDAYRKASVVTGKQITVLRKGVHVAATAVSVEDDFSLKVRYENGRVERLTGGEVSIRV